MFVHNVYTHVDMEGEVSGSCNEEAIVWSRHCNVDFVYFLKLETFTLHGTVQS